MDKIQINITKLLVLFELKLQNSYQKFSISFIKDHDDQLIMHNFRFMQNYK